MERGMETGIFDGVFILGIVNGDMCRVRLGEYRFEVFGT